jgi:hypothetical protein
VAWLVAFPFRGRYGTGRFRAARPFSERTNLLQKVREDGNEQDDGTDIDGDGGGTARFELVLREESDVSPQIAYGQTRSQVLCTDQLGRIGGSLKRLWRGAPRQFRNAAICDQRDVRDDPALEILPRELRSPG